jgi:hypothetical protein
VTISFGEHKGKEKGNVAVKILIYIKYNEPTIALLYKKQ